MLLGWGCFRYLRCLLYISINLFTCLRHNNGCVSQCQNASAGTIPPCMEATITHNAGPVVLLNWWGVMCNAGPVAMHHAAFGSKFRALQPNKLGNCHI